MYYNISLHVSGYGLSPLYFFNVERFLPQSTRVCWLPGKTTESVNQMAAWQPKGGAPCCSQRCSDTHWRAWPVLGALLAKKTHTQVEWETKFGRVRKQGQSSGKIVGSSIFEIRCSISEHRCSIQRSKNRLHEKTMIYF